MERRGRFVDCGKGGFVIKWQKTWMNNALVFGESQNPQTRKLDIHQRFPSRVFNMWFRSSFSFIGMCQRKNKLKNEL